MADQESVLGRAAQRGREALRRARGQLDRARMAQGERSARRVSPHAPYTIRLDHPPTAEARPRYGFGRPSHAGLETVIAASAEHYRSCLDEFAPHFDDLARFAVVGTGSTEPCWQNPWLIGLDTVALYSFARLRRPARYVEIGSGESTKVLARARRDGKLPTRITSIDPAPRTEVDPLCDRIVRSPLELVDLGACFGDLERGDMVFFDGSHRVLPNSDCVTFFLDVLPSLPHGVLVGIHDIYLPDDYPDAFIELWWSEQYLLAAFLLSGSAPFDLVLPTYWASGRTDLAVLLDPLFTRPELRDVNRRGSSFWIET